MKWLSANMPRWNERGAITISLYALAILIAGGSLVWATVALVRGIVAGAPMEEWLASTATLLQGWSVAAVLWAVAWWARTRVQAEHAARPELPRHANAVELLDVGERILAELEELHKDVLLQPEQRPERLEEMHHRRGEARADRVRLAIEKASFGEAQAAMNELREQMGETDEVRQLQRELDAARAAAQDFDVWQTVEEVEGLLEIGSFDRAHERAEELLAQRPDSATARQLLQRVHAAREARQAEGAKELYQEVESLADQRRWRDALVAAQRVLQEYPQSAEARRVEAGKATLEANARLEEVRHARDRIRRLLQQHRYSEALALARDVVARFPETAAADELRQQLDRLERLSQSAQGEEAR